MSQWNNTYAYNNQYQGWNNDASPQYANQPYYPNRDPSNQYVSFNEFLTQMQSNSASNPANYSNLQYENYPPRQYNYPAAQNAQGDSYGYAVSSSNLPNAVGGYQTSVQSQYNPVLPESKPYSNEMILNSNLTATATEFVPKTTMNPSNSGQNIPESNINRGNETSSTNTNNHVGDNFDRNTSSNNAQNNSSTSSLDPKWREKSQSSQQNDDCQERVYNSQEYYKNEEPSNNRNCDSKVRKNESNGRHNNNSRKQDSNRHQDSSSRHKNSERQYEARNEESNSHQYESGYSNNEANSQSYEYSNRNQDPSRQHDTNSRQQESNSRKNDSNGRNYESNNHNYESSNKRGQGKVNYNKSKNKDSERTFYNSSISKDSQDVRKGGGKNWVGSQRLRALERNSTEDEQYANTYNVNREERENSERDRDHRDRDYSDRDHRDRDHRDRDHRDRDHRVRDNREYRDNRDGRDYRDRDNRDNRDYRDRDNRDTRDYRDRDNRDNRDYRDRDNRDTRDYRDRDNRDTRDYRDRDQRDRVQRSEHVPSPSRFRNKHQNNDQGSLHMNSDMTQRERLSEQLDRGTLECLVCCERVKQIDPVWSCGNCYHVLHLRCIRKWAMSSMVESKWRCPACQNTNEVIPSEYRCMCGAIRGPEYQRGAAGAHTCGRACRRTRACPHPCTLLCHPGPCPPCQATITKHCGCGHETRSVMCSSKLPQICGRQCGRTLKCGQHTCAKDCHEGPCDDCTEIITQVCYCPATKARDVACTSETGGEESWSCSATCGRVLACGAHVCRAPCHPPPCEPCARAPERLLTCPCGNTRLDKNSRKSCTDPVPLCGNICTKPLPCGPAGDKHFCKLSCHEGPCPECPDKTVLQCRCGHSSREVPCVDLPEMYNNVLCQKKCNKKLSCGRHRCRTVCCSSSAHRCAVPCARSLACQTHRCDDFCHTGHCAPCPRVSFEELSCECGAEVILPPVRCGTRPPACQAPCPRTRPCGHPPHHSCHSGDCPPCVVLTTKRCHGDHEERKTIPCSQEEFSCGLPCGKPLPCGKHTCIKTCHKGACDTAKCSQPCGARRACGHACAAPCHAAHGGACPGAAPCRAAVRATCRCARRRQHRSCADNARDHAKMVSALAATKMAEGGSMDLSDVQRPGNVLKTLECDDECRVEARTRQLALALQIRNPDVSAKLAPRYSEHVRSTAVKEPSFAQQIHDRLTELVQLAKKSKQKTRSHSFPSMNRQKRQFIHELCEHFGCESVAYDAEPNRNVVATADREKSWLPAMSVLEVQAREAGKRRVPGPVLRAAAPLAPPAPSTSSSACTACTSSSANSSQPIIKSTGGWATLTSTNAWAARNQKPADKPVEKQPEKIDYFDNPPDN